MDDREARNDPLKGPDVANRSMLDSQPLVAKSGYPENSIPLGLAASTCWQDYFLPCNLNFCEAVGPLNGPLPTTFNWGSQIVFDLDS